VRQDGEVNPEKGKIENERDDDETNGTREEMVPEYFLEKRES